MNTARNTTIKSVTTNALWALTTCALLGGCTMDLGDGDAPPATGFSLEPLVLEPSAAVLDRLGTRRIADRNRPQQSARESEHHPLFHHVVRTLPGSRSCSHYGDARIGAPLRDATVSSMRRIDSQMKHHTQAKLVIRISRAA